MYPQASTGDKEVAWVNIAPLGRPIMKNITIPSVRRNKITEMLSEICKLPSIIIIYKVSFNSDHYSIFLTLTIQATLWKRK